MIDLALWLTADTGGAFTPELCVNDVYVVGLNDPIEKILMKMAEMHIGSAVVMRQLAGRYPQLGRRLSLLR